MSAIEQDVPALNLFSSLAAASPLPVRAGTQHGSSAGLRGAVEADCGHLDPYFNQVMGHVQQLLETAFGTSDGATLVISGTGSAGMKAAVANFVEPGAKFAVFANGSFSDRLTEMAKRQGANVVRLEKSWGETFADDEAVEFIRREKPKVVGFVHAETSTGALQSGQAICAAAHEVGALVIADCVTSLGGVPVDFDQTGMDVAYSCTQKGLSSDGFIAEGHVAEGHGVAARSHHCVAQLVSGPQADSRLFHGVAPLSSHSTDFDVLRLTRGAPGHRRGRNREPGSGIAVAISLLSRASERWVCACVFPQGIELRP